MHIVNFIKSKNHLPEHDLNVEEQESEKNISGNYLTALCSLSHSS